MNINGNGTVLALTKIYIYFNVVSVSYHPLPNLLFHANSVLCKYLYRREYAHMHLAECTHS